MTFRHRAGVRLYTSSFDFAQPCVFVKQLPGPILCALHCCRDPFSRSYRVNLPSSLTMNLPSASVYSTRLRVSVYGTGTLWVKLSGFSREYAYLRYCIVRRRCILSTFSSEGGFACPHQRLRSLTGYSVSPRKCHFSVSTSPHKVVTEFLPSLPSASPFGLSLGPDLPRAD